MKDEHNTRLLSFEEVREQWRKPPKKLCMAAKNGSRCVFYEGHAGLHRIAAQKARNGANPIGWIDFAGSS